MNVESRKVKLLAVTRNLSLVTRSSSFLVLEDDVGATVLNGVVGK